MSNHDEHAQMVTDCENRESKLTEWEAGFIQSCRERIDAGRALSPPMEETLNTIWDRIT
jgi:hypothetical protein